MPESQQPIDGQRLMIAHILGEPVSDVLDVGAGDGKWGRLLNGLVPRITALEIWLSYVERYHLSETYTGVVVEDARKFARYADYDVIILGDVLEHLCRKDALNLIATLKEAGDRIYLTIPITKCVQDGTVYGNPYETHLDQWSNEELTVLGWRLLHRGLNSAGTVEIGTYFMRGEE